MLPVFGVKVPIAKHCGSENPQLLIASDRSPLPVDGVNLFALTAVPRLTDVQAFEIAISSNPGIPGAGWL
jgi:hypothetical protein